MKPITKRLARLEEHLQVTLTPRKRLSIVVIRVDRKPSLEGATCTRTLCPDGTLMEVVRLDQSRPGRHELTDDEVERWIETFPIDRMHQS
jgi:hypothetical protein